MAAFFASDIHLRLDVPERSERFARWVSTLSDEDTLTIVGDLCDFWFASRQVHRGMKDCAGLTALADFSRRGDLTILAGNHDTALMPLYARWFRARLISNDCLESVHGHRIWFTHGHRLGARPLWKEALESRLFARAFASIPAPLASRLESLNDAENERSREASDRRHLEIYRRRAQERAALADLVVLGHVHRLVEETHGPQRLIVLGNWHRRSSYLRVEPGRATLICEDSGSDPGTPSDFRSL